MSGSIMVCGLLLLHARHRYRDDARMVAANGELVAGLQLTDLCLFTEARYTRHPAMADRHSPFQDHPLALEHFPSGSLVTPPFFHREAP
jgi:hypothetical protein